MEKIKYRVKGHESFILRDGWLTKGLMAVNENPKVFSNNFGADALGVGTNMAKAIRYWLKAANLIDESQNKGAELSDIGRVIFEKDPYFEDIFSLWIIHVNIATNFELATSWNVFFNDINVNSFKRDELVGMMTAKLLERTNEKTIPERSIKDDCAALINMYLKVADEGQDPEDKNISPFSELGLLQINDGIYEKTRPSLESISPYLILYLIENELTKNKSIQIDDISDKEDMPGKILNLNRIMLNEYLDYLNDHAYITVNRTAGLDIVYQKKDISLTDIMKKYYSEVDR